MHRTRLELADYINKLFRSASRLDVYTRESIGKALIEAQTLTPNGKFGEWIRMNLPFDHIRANQFMRIYRESIGVQPATKPRTPAPEVKTEYVYMPAQGGTVTEQVRNLTTQLGTTQMELDRLKADNAMLLKSRDEARVAKIKINQLEREIYILRAAQATTPRHHMTGGSAGFTSEEIRILRASLHPDRPERTHEQLTKAAQIFNSKVK